MNIQKTSDVTSRTIFGLVYGESGRGKTFAASTFSTPTLIISAESGVLSLKDFDIDYVEVKTWSEFRSVIADLMKNDHPYENIYIDSLTEISKLMRDELGGDDMGFKEWGKYSSQMERFLRAMRSNGKYNVWMTALAKESDDQNLKGADIYGKIAYNLFQYFDFVFSIHVKEDGARVFLTREFKGYFGKVRGSDLADAEPANFAAITQKIKKGQT